MCPPHLHTHIFSLPPFLLLSTSFHPLPHLSTFFPYPFYFFLHSCSNLLSPFTISFPLSNTSPLYLFIPLPLSPRLSCSLSCYASLVLITSFPSSSFPVRLRLAIPSIFLIKFDSFTVVLLRVFLRGYVSISALVIWLSVWEEGCLVGCLPLLSLCLFF